MSEFITRFATSAERIAILQGFLDYRADLRNIGIDTGYQWVDGSFVEVVETARGRPPNDVDVVTIAARPISDVSQFVDLINHFPHLFLAGFSKVVYKVDGYHLDTLTKPDLLIPDAIYFFSLFSHQRVTSLWKGMVKIDLSSDDDVARVMLNNAVVGAHAKAP